MGAFSDNWRAPQNETRERKREREGQRERAREREASEGVSADSTVHPLVIYLYILLSSYIYMSTFLICKQTSSKTTLIVGERSHSECIGLHFVLCSTKKVGQMWSGTRCAQINVCAHEHEIAWHPVSVCVFHTYMHMHMGICWQLLYFFQSLCLAECYVISYYV